MTTSSDRNMLMGILALQMDFINREQLLAAMNGWVLRKATPLEEILLELKALTPDTVALLQALVAKHLELHGNNAQQSLQAISSIGPLQEELRSLADPDIDATLTVVGGSSSTSKAYTSTLPHQPSKQDSSNRFRVIRPHAKGGLGEVFVARDTELNREVALKEIQERFAQNEDSRSRFMLEAEVTGGLEHPGIVPVYGLGQYADGRPFYAMRFIKGDSLKDAIDRFHTKHRGAKDFTTGEVGVEFRQLLGRFIDVCQAIEYAHSRGVLHRDLKPGNIMLGKYGETLVVDWGLAKVVGRAEQHQSSGETTLSPDAGSGSAPTQMGSAIGTPAFMSPEQAAGDHDALGPAADVYSLGATLYCLLTGEAPFNNDDSQNLFKLLEKVKRGEFRRPRELNANIPRSLDAVCLNAMSTSPKDRYASPVRLANDIEHWLADEPVTVLPERAHERCTRFLRKHRTLAFSGVTALAAIALISFIASMLINQQKSIIANREQEARQLSQEKSTLAEQEKEARQLAQENYAKAEANAKDAMRQADLARRRMYDAQMTLTQNAWNTGEISRVDALMGVHGPGTETADLRSFEWNYFHKLRHSYVRKIETGQGRIQSLAISPDGKKLATGAAGGGGIKLWDLPTGDFIRRMSVANEQRVTRLAFFPDSQRLVSVGGKEACAIWDTNTGERLHSLSTDDGIVNALSISPDGNLVAFGGEDKKIRFWNVTSGEEAKQISDFNSEIVAINFSPNGEDIIAATRDNSISVWDWSNAQKKTQLNAASWDRPRMTGKFYSAHQVRDLSLSPDGKLLAVAYDGLYLVELATGMVRHHLSEHSRDVQSTTFIANGDRVLSTGFDNQIKIWDVRSGEELQTLRGHTDGCFAIQASSDGEIIASGDNDGKVLVWDITSDQRPNVIPTLPDTYNVAHSPNGIDLAIGTAFGMIRIWNRSAHCFSHYLRTDKTTSIRAVTFTPDGSVIIASSLDGLIYLWDVTSGKRIGTLKGHSGYIDDLKVSIDGNRLISSSNEQTIVWDLKTQEAMSTLPGAMGIAFASEDRTLLIAMFDVREYDSLTGRELRIVVPSDPSDGSSIRDIAIDSNGNRLAIAKSNRITIFDVNTGKIDMAIVPPGWTDGVEFSPDGQRLVSSGVDLIMWDATTGLQLLAFRGDEIDLQGIIRSAFAPDGNSLVVGRLGGGVQIFDSVPLSEQLREDIRLHDRVRNLIHSRDSIPTAINELRRDSSISEETRARALAMVNAIDSLSHNALIEKVTTNEAYEVNPLGSFSLAVVKFDFELSMPWIREFPLNGVDRFRTIPISSRKRAKAIGHLDSDEGMWVLQGRTILSIEPNGSQHVMQQLNGEPNFSQFSMTVDGGRWAYANPTERGAEIILVKKTEAQKEANLGFGYHPTFSTDGEKLLFTSTNDEIGWHIAIHENGETRRIKIPEHPAVDIRPCMSPDNRRIAFSMKGEDGTMQIGIADADGSNVRQLTHAGDLNSQASFSPNGNYLAFIRKKLNDAPATSYAIVVVNVATGEETAVATVSPFELESGPVWRKLPDAK